MKKYYIYFLLLFIIPNALLLSKSFTDRPGTDGLSKSTAYELWDLADLLELRDSINSFGSLWHEGKHFKLMTNIDNVTQTIAGYPFRGYFHGNGKKIILSMFYDPLYPSHTLFTGGIGYNGVVDSLSVEGYIEIGYAGITNLVQAGYNSTGVISNCINNVTIVQNGVINPITGKLEGSVGGITYSNGGTISNCINNGDITGVDRIGGIAGENEGTIINCINTGNITATASGDNSIFSGVGGIVGTVANYCQSISNCVNIGSVVGQGFVGGIVGLANGYYPTAVTPITNCINYGYVRGINGVGGVLGYMFNPQGVNVSNCVNVGVVEGEEDTGSIVGKEGIGY